MLLGGIAGALFGVLHRAPPRRLFRDGDHRLRPGVLLHRLPVELAHRRRRRLARLLPRSRSISDFLASTSVEQRTLSTISCWSVFALAVAVQALILRSPFGRTMLAIRENERRARFLGMPVERHIWMAFTLSCFFMGFAGASTRCSTISPIRGA